MGLHYTVKKVIDNPTGDKKIANRFYSVISLREFSMLFALPKQIRVDLLDRKARNFFREIN
jgi:hypothetical protein